MCTLVKLFQVLDLATQAHGDLKLCEGCEQILEVVLLKVSVQCALQVSLLNKNLNSMYINQEFQSQ